jgi:hypothetical protein
MFLMAANLLAVMGVPWGYLIEGLAMIGATALIARLDVAMRRPGVPEVGWRRPPLMWVAAALLAGVGAAILGSEIDNIVRDRVPLVTPAPPVPSPGAEAGPTIVPGPEIYRALTHGLIAPFCLALLGLGITMRNLFTGLPGWVALVIGALATAWSRHEHPAYWLPWMLAPLIGGWAYARSHAIWLAFAALLPQHAVVWLDLFGLLPGIPGFDTEPKPVVVFQPVWFDLLGVLCLFGGIFLLIRGPGAGAPASGLPGRPPPAPPEDD